MADESLLLERSAAVLTLTVNRPSVLNALNGRLIDELTRVVEHAREDAGVRVLIVTGAGDKAFVAGADIDELARLSPPEARDTSRRGQLLFERLEHLGRPVIAAVNGFALGGGCELAMACTIRLAADTAKFGQPEINLGLMPGFAGTQRLPRLIGRGRALEMLLTGNAIDASEALRIGLVNRVVPAADLMPVARDLAQTLASKPAIATRHILDAVARGIDMPLPDAAAFEAALFGLTFATEDLREGTRAFLEKRPPSFKGQ